MRALTGLADNSVFEILRLRFVRSGEPSKDVVFRITQCFGWFQQQLVLGLGNLGLSQREGPSKWSMVGVLLVLCLQTN